MKTPIQLRKPETLADYAINRAFCESGNGTNCIGNRNRDAEACGQTYTEAHVTFAPLRHYPCTLAAAKTGEHRRNRTAFIPPKCRQGGLKR